MGTGIIGPSMSGKRPRGLAGKPETGGREMCLRTLLLVVEQSQLLTIILVHTRRRFVGICVLTFNSSSDFHSTLYLLPRGVAIKLLPRRTGVASVFSEPSFNDPRVNISNLNKITHSA